MRKISVLLCGFARRNKMASLVADYGDSGSGDSDGEDSNAALIAEAGQRSQAACANFFGEDAGASSEDSDTGTDQDNGNTADEEKVESVPKLPSPFLQPTSKLPTPHLKSGETKSSSYVTEPTSSVFKNPFVQAEQDKLGILEKHVRLTEAAPQKPASKQVCFKFKKGTCHLGAKCRFFHDRSNIALGQNSDRSGSLAGTETEQDTGPGFGRGDRSFKFPGWGGGGVGGERLYHPAAQFSRGQPVDPRATDDDNYMNAAKGKKRFGVSDNLVPPKKAMTALQDLRKKERPWTAKK